MPQNDQRLAKILTNKIKISGIEANNGRSQIHDFKIQMKMILICFIN